MVTVEEIINALRSVIDPELKKDIVSMGMIKDITINGNKVSFTLELTTPACPFNNDIEKSVRDVINKLGLELDMKVTARVIEGRAMDISELLPKVKNVIAVASGKGGVGKSTVAVNLAVSLARANTKVGLLDADIYGPSIPLMLGLKPGLVADENGKIIPQEIYGIKVISMGLAAQKEYNVGIWRGPIISSIIKQFLTDVNWGELDYLVVDLPPGTGDAPLTLAQTIPITGVVVVTTPQNAAMSIALKAALMFKKLGIPIIGVVENMSYFKCQHCNNISHIFGSADEERIINLFNAPLVGRIPLHIKIMEDSDLGKPIALDDDENAQAFHKLARNVAGRISVIAIELQKSLLQ